MHAIQWEQIAIAELLIKKGADINLQNKLSHTASQYLNYAVERRIEGSYKLQELLRQHEAK